MAKKQKYNPIVLGAVVLALVLVGIYIIYRSQAATNADINGDGSVNILDMSILATNYGGGGKTFAQGDITGDGLVNILDLSILAAQWGNMGGDLLTVSGLSDGQTVSGNITIQITPASSVTNFERIEYYIDDELNNQELNAPYCFPAHVSATTCDQGYDTQQLTNGSHVFKVIMRFNGTSYEESISFTVNNSQVEPPPSGTSYGPDGTHWPSDTPAYSTPANKFANSLSELNSVLSTAQPGDVIEVAPHTYSSDLTITNGIGSGQNVLVRPRLGQVQSVRITGTLHLNAPNVTIAGLWANSIRANNGSSGSNYARIVTPANGFISISAKSATIDGFGFYEIVSEGIKVSDVADRFTITSDCTTARALLTNVTISGSWLDSTYRQIGSGVHIDNMQTYGTSGQPCQSNGWGNGVIGKLTIVDTYLGAGHNAAFQNGDIWEGSTEMHSIIHSYLRSCAMADSLPAGAECLRSYSYDGMGGRQVISDSVIAGGSLLRTSTPTLTPLVGYTLNNNIFGHFGLCRKNPAGSPYWLCDGSNVNPNSFGSGNVEGGTIPAPPTRPNYTAIWNAN